MFIFGHLGIGRTLTRPWNTRYSAWLLALGMLLPDLIDKPLYYARLSEFFSCTRTVGHTAILMLLIFAAGRLSGRRAFMAIGVGVATHLALDCLLDLVAADGPSSAWRAVTWPLLGRDFTRFYSASISAHLGRLIATPVVLCEVAGLSLLAWERRRARTAADLGTR